ncbi:hypothetical protein OFN32_38355, partial [Escherichia coli]|nr:hypothetical protein [Escherichia coli]
MQDVLQGIEQGRFQLRPDQALGALGMIAGSTLSAILGVSEGLRTWRDAGTDAAELSLRAFGLLGTEPREI